MKPKHHTKERGFTILLAALVASLVLSLGISVFAIAQKQLVLASTGRNSQYAFYAADTAAECALYWDLRHSYFATTAPAVPAVEDVKCDEQQLNPTGYPGAETYPYSIVFEIEPNGYCAQVTITKDTSHPRTLVRADGFSVACASIETSARTLQRSVELTY